MDNVIYVSNDKDSDIENDSDDTDNNDADTENDIFLDDTSMADFKSKLEGTKQTNFKIILESNVIEKLLEKFPPLKSTQADKTNLQVTTPNEDNAIDDNSRFVFNNVSSFTISKLFGLWINCKYMDIIMPSIPSDCCYVNKQNLNIINRSDTPVADSGGFNLYLLTFDGFGKINHSSILSDLYKESPSPVNISTIHKISINCNTIKILCKFTGTSMNYLVPQYISRDCYNNIEAFLPKIKDWTDNYLKNFKYKTKLDGDTTEVDNILDKLYRMYYNRVLELVSISNNTLFEIYPNNNLLLYYLNIIYNSDISVIYKNQTISISLIEICYIQNYINNPDPAAAAAAAAAAADADAPAPAPAKTTPFDWDSAKTYDIENEIITLKNIIVEELGNINNYYQINVSTS
jgi:hypothetical protein